jgi:hypothetical protein
VRKREKEKCDVGFWIVAGGTMTSRPLCVDKRRVFFQILRWPFKDIRQNGGAGAKAVEGKDQALQRGWNQSTFTFSEQLKWGSGH